MSEESKKTNSKYKDRLFCMLFGRDKRNAISLYNALNGTNYSEDEDIEVTTIDDAIYINMKNDASFIVDGHMSLFEQQSSLNPNMPLRGLMYFGNLYDSFVEGKGLNIYGSKLIKIPTPQYYVLYNGTVEAPAKGELKLSDAFAKESPEGMYEWTATFVNLNKGKNEVLLGQCKPLEEYMLFIERIREFEAKGMESRKAVDAAVQFCIDAGIMKEFLVKHRAEVISVVLTEFNQKRYEDSIRTEGALSQLFKSICRGRMTIEEGIHDAAEDFQMSKEEFLSCFKSYQMNAEK